MSRAVNIDATEARVVKMAARHNATISAIEPLLPRGTRAVFTNIEDARTIAEAFGRKVLTGAVTRMPTRPHHSY
ncbi:hypothetical protein ACFO8O_08685 [Hephaestia sp. GCM10023244]|uniref:hypothetical protein n=1 Tax=unclassified Hephaestia TaxID=2631281 RepID=UPI0020776A7A|nr:hypothetical protein [Hephaestia sp. MAHUQ-44]MCM8731033.1 hypothetical protein [Hephaestia sp. MAHUQ-44]